MVFETVVVFLPESKEMGGHQNLNTKLSKNNGDCGFKGFMTTLSHMSLNEVQSSWPSTNAGFGSLATRYSTTRLTVDFLIDDHMQRWNIADILSQNRLYPSLGRTTLGPTKARTLYGAWSCIIQVGIAAIVLWRGVQWQNMPFKSNTIMNLRLGTVPGACRHEFNVSFCNLLKWTKERMTLQI